MNKNDILFRLSGGAHNALPGLSLGGGLSDQEATGKLFDDIPDGVSGVVDYRCVYVCNNSGSERLRKAVVRVKKGLDGAEVLLGVQSQDGVQAISVRGLPTNGHFQLAHAATRGGNRFRGVTREILWVPDEAVMAQRIAAVLNSLGMLEGVSCVGSRSEDGFDFLVTFADGRSHGVLGVVNELGVDVAAHVLAAGGAVNAEAVEIGQSNNPPAGVQFDVEAAVGTLYPGDVVAVWLRRFVTPGGGGPLNRDHFRLEVDGRAEASSRLYGVSRDKGRKRPLPR